MKYTKENEELGLPKNFKFGIELEAYNVKIKGKNGLYVGDSADYIKSQNWHMATATEEALVKEGGAELVSPILRDKKEDWESIRDICEHMKKFPGKHGDKVVADEKCGLHVHFDANCLASNPERMKNFLRIYAEAEELIYKVCNDKDDPIRKGAIFNNLKGINVIYSLWLNGMAAPIGKKIMKQIEDGTLKVSYKKFGRLKMLAGKYKLDQRRYTGLNLTNIGNEKKNTIEFRMANGTLNPEVIKQNVFLYASLINTSIQATKHPDKYKEKLDTFYRTDVSEKEKLDSFLNLIMDDPEDRKIYEERWESVKDAKVFAQNDSLGFASNRFKREEFKKIAERTPLDLIQSTYNNLKGFMQRTMEMEI